MSDDVVAAVNFDADGLVPAIAQDIETGDVLMMAWMNADSLRRTIDEGRMVYWSRSRQELWRKGDTSGDHQTVREAYYDCDRDTLLFKVIQHGRGACHTGERTCFFTPINGVEPTNDDGRRVSDAEPAEQPKHEPCRSVRPDLYARRQAVTTTSG